MPRRRTQWLGTTIEAVSVGTSTSVPGTQSLIGAGGLSGFEKFTSPTIVRIVGTLYHQLGHQGGVVTNADKLVLGLICQDENTPAPNPIQEVQHPWLWTVESFVHTTTRDMPVWNGSSVVNDQYMPYGTPINRFHIDARVMRKVPRDCELRIAWIHAAVAGSPTPWIHGHFRVLVKE